MVACKNSLTLGRIDFTTDDDLTAAATEDVQTDAREVVICFRNTCPSVQTRAGYTDVCSWNIYEDCANIKRYI